ncbi:MAG: outer membrane lipid asymmetry maintenance protein MlaD [Rhodothalassiaceae bacterium]
MNSNLVESLIGAVVLVVAAGFLYIAYTTTDVAGRDGYPLIARFERVGGLNLGADVRLSGIKVGTVTREELDPDSYQAVVHFVIDRSIRLPVDSGASITSDGLLGDTYLELSPGGAPDYLAPGDQVEFTEDPIDIWSLVSKAVFSGDSASDGGAK